MKKLGWILFTLLVAGYLVNSYIENKDKREAQQAQAERIEQIRKAAVSRMVARTGAIDDWDSRLGKGKRSRDDEILTIDLERLWLRHRPILFPGWIEDIRAHGQSQYVVLVDRGLTEPFFLTHLQLSLIADKNKVDSFLKEHPNLFGDYGFNNGVAVVGRIKSIRTRYIPDMNGEYEKALIGVGKLVDIMYTKDAFDS